MCVRERERERERRELYKNALIFNHYSPLQVYPPMVLVHVRPGHVVFNKHSLMSTHKVALNINPVLHAHVNAPDPTEGMHNC